MLGNRWQTDNLYNFTPVDFINISIDSLNM